MSALTQALIRLRPGAEFSNVDDTFLNVRWDGPGAKPTQEEVDAAIARLDVPLEVTAGRMILALNELGLLEDVEAAIASVDGMTERLWSRAPTFLRDDPLVLGIAAALGKTEAELDDIFRLAATK